MPFSKILGKSRRLQQGTWGTEYYEIEFCSSPVQQFSGPVTHFPRLFGLLGIVGFNNHLVHALILIHFYQGHNNRLK